MLKEINIRDLPESAVKLIGDDWGLVAAGNEGGFNMMTVSWGAVGEMWNKDAVFVFIRPQRYTFEFFERESLFTLSFFAPEDKKILSFCGANSGRDGGKAAAAGLTPMFVDGTVGFEQAKYTIVCRKLSSQFLDPKGFEDDKIGALYSANDYHKMYIGEILKVFEKK